MTFRLIDDVLTVNNPFRADFFQNCYPDFLTLNDTSLDDGSVNFLGMHISATPSVVIDVYDKKKDFPFQVVRYPHLDSAIPNSLPYGVFTGQLHRFMRICSLPGAFVRNSCEVALRLAAQKSSISRLRRVFCAFTHTNVSRSRWNVTASVLNHLFDDSLFMQLPDTFYVRSRSKSYGMAWMTRNFPSLVSMSNQDLCAFDMSSVCNHVASRHLLGNQLPDFRQPIRTTSCVASGSRGLRWLRVNFPSIGPLGL